MRTRGCRGWRPSQGGDHGQPRAGGLEPAGRRVARRGHRRRRHADRRGDEGGLCCCLRLSSLISSAVRMMSTSMSSSGHSPTGGFQSSGARLAMIVSRLGLRPRHSRSVAKVVAILSNHIDGHRPSERKAWRPVPRPAHGRRRPEQLARPARPQRKNIE